MRNGDEKSILEVMTNLDPEICRKLKEARRQAGISQTDLAREVGCGQPALSMFEQGDGTKLNDDVVKALCRKFNVELSPPKKPGSEAYHSFAGPHAHAGGGYCPNPSCPSHREYFVAGERFLEPDREREDPVGGKFCAICGEVLERSCPTCGAPIHAGAVCSHCGKPYVVCSKSSTRQ